jgi:ribonuclease R
VTRPPRGRVPVAPPVVGLIEKRGRYVTAKPFFPERNPSDGPRSRGGRRINIANDNRAKAGDIVLVAPNGAKGGHGKVLKTIGRPDVARDVIEALMLHRGLRRRFPPDVERAARAAAADPPGGDVPGRRDLVDLPTFTIDPPTARDFDDAISAERLEDGSTIRVWVHIADVAAHVPPGGPVDREAHRRATSVYVPGAVEPMLPEALSNDACSLRPGAERLAVTVELDFEGKRVRRSAFYRSRIRSDARLDYPQVDRIFAGAERASDPWARPLDAARAVARALGEARAAKGALEVESSEPSFAFNREGHVAGLVAEQQTESHQLIEHLMIAANEAVAGLLEDRGLPALFRVHENPDGARVARLVAQLESLDVPVPAVSETLSGTQAAEAVGDISRQVAAHVRATGHGGRGYTTLLLRTLKQAYYSPRNVGHAGLRSPRYCHFTSPIRRYPDLICHRSLLNAIGAEEEPPQRGAMEEAGSWCSSREREAMVIERSADDIAGCFLLERELFEGGWQQEFTGEVTSVISSGAFITFGDGHDGMLAVRRLPGDWWELNETETALLGTRSSGGIRIGEPVTVQVVRVDTIRGRVDLAPVELGA